MGVGQGSALSPPLSVLCIVPVIWLFAQAPPGAGTTLLSYVDNRSIMDQAPRVELNLAVLKKAYARIYMLLTALGLEIEHGKTEVFHFSRAN